MTLLDLFYIIAPLLVVAVFIAVVGFSERWLEFGDVKDWTKHLFKMFMRLYVLIYLPAWVLHLIFKVL